MSGKIYHRSTQGWKFRAGALRAAKGLRDIGYKARVKYEPPWYRVYWSE